MQVSVIETIIFYQADNSEVVCKYMHFPNKNNNTTDNIF